MASFNLNLEQTKENILSNKQVINNYEEDLNIYMSNILNFDSVWNDKNTISFIELVKKERYEFNEHIESLSDYLNIIANFCDQLDEIIESNLGISRLKVIQYDYEKTNELIETITKIYNLIDKNYTILNELNIPQEFKYYSEIKQIELNYYKYRAKARSMKSKLNNIKNRVESLIVKTKSKVDNFDSVYISNNFCEHSYKVVSSVISKVVVEKNFQDANAVSATKTVNLSDNNYENNVKENKVFNQQIHNELFNYNLTELEEKKEADINKSIAILENSSLHEIEKFENISKGIENVDLQDSTFNKFEEIKSVNENVNMAKLKNSNSNLIGDFKKTNNKIEEADLLDSELNFVNEVNTIQNIKKANLSETQLNYIGKKNAANNIIDVQLK